ncbi:hypothetical protein [uncultured Helicobacter sp.]|uniref:hypothetical protein n=1 Tax=uncultured Helicobacter sp. TaxID=175537 RepID=UPI00374EDD89
MKKTENILEVVTIPNIDTSFIEEIKKGGIADSGVESNGDTFFSYRHEAPTKETSSERLERFGFDAEKIKCWC